MAGWIFTVNDDDQERPGTLRAPNGALVATATWDGMTRLHRVWERVGERHQARAEKRLLAEVRRR